MKSDVMHECWTIMQKKNGLVVEAVNCSVSLIHMSGIDLSNANDMEKNNILKFFFHINFKNKINI